MTLSDSITMTRAELAAMIGQAVIAALAAAKPASMSAADKQRAYRERQKALPKK